MAGAQDAIGDATTWLIAQQEVDGAFTGEPRLVLRDTAEVVAALGAVDPSSLARGAAIDALAGRASPLVDLEARRIVALSTDVPAVVLAEALATLAAARTPDGGWSVDASFEVATAIDTALAVRALLAGGALDVAAAVLAHDRLAVLQNADGGFGPAIGEAPDVVTTAEVVLALADLAAVLDVSSELEPAAAYLASAQAGDGGFPVIPGSASDVTTTVVAVRALRRAGTLTPAADLAAQAYVLDAQLPDGSFESDPYTTALAIQVLGGARPNLAVVSVALSAASVTEGALVQVSVRVDNRGVAVAGASELALYTGGALLESAAVGALDPGAGVDVVFEIDTAGRSGSVVVEARADDGVTVAESTELDNARFATLFVSQPGDEPPGANRPPAFVTAPVVRATAGGSYLYEADAVDPDGDAVSYLLAIGPAGMAVDAGTGLVEWTVQPDAGHVHVVLAARDPSGASALQAYAIEVSAAGEPLGPVFETTPSSLASVGAGYEYVVAASDPDGGPVTLHLSAGPPGMTLDGPSATVTWIPAADDVGEHVVRLTAEDDEGASAEQQWIVIVDADALGPNVVVVAVDANAAVTDPQSLALSGTATVVVGNHGDAAASETDVVVFEDRDGDEVLSAADARLGTTTLPALGAHGSVTLAVDVAGELLFRDNRLFAMADAAAVVAERREDDNTWVSGREARFTPAPGPLTAALELEWLGVDALDPHRQVIMSPAVAQLTDDDGDGRAGAGDVPDILFFATNSTGTDIQGTPSRVRAIDGRTGSLVLDVAAIPGVVRVQAAASPAVADLDGDGAFPEILVPAMDNFARMHVAALEHDGAFRWLSPVIPNGFPTRADGGAPSVADLDADGTPEVVFGASILQADGSLRCTGAGPGAGIHVAGNMGAYSVVADLDLDGDQEVVAGNTAYDGADCSVVWSRADLGDGYAAVGQLDGDPEPEVVLLTSRLVSTSGLVALEHTGETKWSMTPPGLGGRGGPPAIGDVDGDGQAEIAIAGSANLSVIETDGSVRWLAATSDPSSGLTGPTIADLDGDGETEVLYADELRFRIYAGRNGAVLFTADNRSGTLVEYPTVADVDADGRAEVVLASNEVFDAAWTSSGIRVFGDDRWAPSRPLWNEHAYHFTNLRCDQTVPDVERPSWQAVGTYRAQHPLPEDRALREELRCDVGTAELSASRIVIDRAGCPDTVSVVVRVGNGGEADAPVAVPVRLFEADAGGTYAEVATAATSGSLAPGQFEDVAIPIAAAEGARSYLVEVDPEGAIADGRRTNNAHVADAFACARNRPPTFTTSPVLVATAGEPYGFAATADDADLDVLGWSLAEAPAVMTVAPATGVVLWVPAAEQVGQHLVRLEVEDGRGGLDVLEWIVAVEAGPGEPPPEVAIDGMTLALAASPGDPAPNGTVDLVATLDNLLAGGRDGTVAIEVLDAAGAVVATPLHETPYLFLGAGPQTFAASWDVGPAAPGPYLVRATAREDDRVLRAAAAVLVSADRALVARVATDRDSYGANEDVLVTAAVQNTGVNAAFTELALVIEVPGGGAPLFEETFFPVDLPPGASEERQSVWPTGVTAPGDYVARLTVRDGAVELAEVEAPFRIAPSAEEGRALSGALACTPGVSSPGDALVAAASLTNTGNVDLAGLSATARLVDPALGAAVREAATTVDLTRGATSAVDVPLDTTGLPEGSYGLSLEVATATRVLLALVDDCTLEIGDTTPPTISIEGVAPGGVYPDTVHPVVTVTDASAVTVVITLDGVPFVSGDPVAAEGEHLLEVTATDAADNVATASVPFAIDRTPPVIDVTGVADGECRATATPVVTFTDPHLATTSLTLDGAPFASGTTVDADGDHTLDAAASDLAGLSASRSVSFTIDGVAPEISVTGVADGGVYPGAVFPVFEATDDHLVTLVATLDGAPFVSGTEVSAVASHVLEVTAVDCAGNAEVATVDFEIRPAGSAFGVTLSIVAPPARLVAFVPDDHDRCAERTSFVEDAFAPTDVPFVVVTSWRDVFDELHAGSATAVLVFGDESLRDLRREELRESVAFGDGMVTIATSAGHQPKLEDVWGAEIRRACSERDRVVTIEASALGPERAIEIEGRNAATELRAQGGEVVGSYDDGRCEGDPALVTAGYGRGRSVLLGFDPSRADAPSRDEAMALLVDAVRFVSSAQVEVLSGAPFWLELQAENLDGAVPFAEVRLIHPEALAVLETDPMAALAPGVATWTDAFAEDEERTYLAALSAPDEAATWPVRGEVVVAGELAGAAALDVLVARSACDVLSDAVLALEAIDAADCQDHGGAEPVLARLEHVELCCDGAAPCEDDDDGCDDDDHHDHDDDGGSCECEDGRDAEEALDDVLRATQKLRTVDCEGVDAVRLDLDRLIRTLQIEVGSP